MPCMATSRHSVASLIGIGGFASVAKNAVTTPSHNWCALRATALVRNMLPSAYLGVMRRSSLA